MGESELIVHFDSEVQLVEFSEYAGRQWRALGLPALLLGLRGELGSGKTTWVRGLLRGLGYDGRVPSPTYTLLEQYVFPDLTIVHLDLYRLAVEWPERAPRLDRACDLTLTFRYAGPTGRDIELNARSEPGIEALRVASDAASK